MDGVVTINNRNNEMPFKDTLVQSDVKADIDDDEGFVGVQKWQQRGPKRAANIGLVAHLVQYSWVMRKIVKCHCANNFSSTIQKLD
jgi:hypothetical protein